MQEPQQERKLSVKVCLASFLVQQNGVQCFAIGQSELLQKAYGRTFSCRKYRKCDLVAGLQSVLGPALLGEHSGIDRFAIPVGNVALRVLGIKENLNVRIDIAEFGDGRFEVGQLGPVVCRTAVMRE